jgi:hypothetical protein
VIPPNFFAKRTNLSNIYFNNAGLNNIAEYHNGLILVLISIPYDGFPKKSDEQANIIQIF